MKILLIFICLLLFSCNSITSHRSLYYKEFIVEKVVPKFIEEKEFVNIKEYLTGKESISNKLIMRTNDKIRTGLYLIITTSHKLNLLPADTKIICEIYYSDKLNPKIYEFILPKTIQIPKTRDLYLGLTGDDWNKEIDGYPTAWKITLLDSNKKIISEESSQIWNL